MKLATAVSPMLLAGLALCACRSAEPAPFQAQPQDRTQQGIALYQQGKYAEAQAALEGASGAEANAYLAASLVKQKKYAEAEGPAKAALAADPQQSTAAAALGESLASLKRYDEAIQRMSSFISGTKDAQDKSGAAYAFFWRGQAYYAKKQPDKMVADFETFLKLAPNAPEAATVRQLLASFK
jgi:tetratricopeptide (TPR) repeat protein